MVPVLPQGLQKQNARISLKTNKTYFSNRPLPGGYLSVKRMRMGDLKEIFILALFSFKPFEARSVASAF